MYIVCTIRTYILRKHASVNIKYIGRKEQEVYFISSHVGILHNEQLTLQQTNYFLQNLTSLMTRARVRVCIVQVIINGTDKNESEEG